MSKIVLTNVDKFYGKNHVLKNLNLTIEDGDFMTLLGPSGCGKTTTLRVVSGLEKPQNGFIHMDDKEIVRPKIWMLSSPTRPRISTFAPSSVPSVTAPFIMNFMLPVPLASLPAVEICSLMSAAG